MADIYRYSAGGKCVCCLFFLTGDVLKFYLSPPSPLHEFDGKLILKLFLIRRREREDEGMGGKWIVERNPAEGRKNYLNNDVLLVRDNNKKFFFFFFPFLR